ncbi:MAG: hypothetical protein JWN34_1178 [Bryobacterales bacterium]|nr:hypothetical protein [Bryobacterales bacterium]
MTATLSVPLPHGRGSEVESAAPRTAAFLSRDREGAGPITPRESRR